MEGVFSKYDAYVVPKRNHLRSAVNFHRRRQNESETFDNFVTDLKILVKECGYQENERMLGDAIVLGARQPAVREKCIDKGDELTLEMAITTGQNEETSRESLKVITEEDAHAHAVRRSDHRRHRAPSSGASYVPPKSYSESPHQARNGARPRTRFQNKTRSKLCYKCGYDMSHETCPAQNSKCNYCGKKGHLVKCCRLKKRNEAHQVQEESEDDSAEYLHLINAVDKHSKSCANEWWETVNVGTSEVLMQIDTGAVRSLMPYKVYTALDKSTKEPLTLSKTDQKFQSYTKHSIKVEGKVSLQVKYKDAENPVTFYVVHVDQRPLLSGAASKQLGLVERIHAVDSISKYPRLQKTTGTLPGTYRIKVDPTVPPVIHGPRRQPKALTDKIVSKLKDMETSGHIVKVTEPTDWVSSMVTVLKKGKVRICIDPKDLNHAIRREHYPIPTVEEVVSLFPNAKVFSVLDAKSGFLQIKLDYESSLLTTFNTPVGRYRWLRLPFGVKCAPELFQRIMDTMLEDIPGARSIMDDILIGGVDDDDHDRILDKVAARAVEWNLALNPEKCQVKKRKVLYHGHTLGENGLEPSEEKVRALREMPVPECKEEVRSFLGLVQYLAKFIPNMSSVDAPLRELTKKDIVFYWDKPQQDSFEQLIELCTQAPVLATFDNNKDVIIQCDASSYAVGGVLLQDGRPIAYTSRALTETEKLYAQIEKETLAIVHCCKKFHYYVFGRPVLVESDHKPLQSIFAKPLLSAPMRLQAMMLKLQPYDLTVTFKPGKEIPIGDALSRANLPDNEPDIEEVLVNMVDYIAVTPVKYEQFQSRTADELNELHQMILKGWPDTKEQTPHCIRDYWSVRDELAVLDGIIYKGSRIVVPPSMRSDMISQVHGSHLGVVKCKQRAREALFWPGMSSQIEDAVSDCVMCNTYQNKQGRETMKATKTPDLPWVQVASDIFDWKGEHYVLTVDYYSKFIEVDKLTDMSSQCTIETIKSQISRHGIPEVLRSDNGPQYASREFAKFCQDYEIQHVTSSPTYPQSNGEAERAVQTVKRLWSKAKDNSNCI